MGKRGPFSANMNIKENELETNVLLESGGRVSVSVSPTSGPPQLFRAIITDITCDLDLQNFPFDQASSLESFRNTR